MPTILARNIRAIRDHLGMNQARFADEVGAQQSYVSKWESKGSVPEALPLERIAALGETTIADLTRAAWRPRVKRADPAPVLGADIVGIQHIDLAYGLGATFADSPVEVDVLQFPRVWVESITRSPASLLTWTRGRGDSMAPTIDDGDMMLFDRSQRRVLEQDAIWAFTVGETASVKRLRVKGDRFQILSDNPSVPADEEPIDFVNIVARVIFVGKTL